MKPEHIIILGALLCGVCLVAGFLVGLVVGSSLADDSEMPDHIDE